MDKPRPLNEIVQDGISILGKELGVVETARFINRFSAGYKDYTEEREQLFAGMTLDEMVSEIKRMRNE
jgi:hypothetical protein